MHNRPTPLASALRAALLGFSLSASSLAVQAADAPVGNIQAPRSYAIAAGSLDRVLGAFGQQAGVMIAADSALTRGLRSDGLQGSFAVNEALARLLAPLGLQAIAEGEGYRVLPRAEAQNGSLELGATTVNAGTLGAITENTGSYTTGSTATATKMGLSLRETPQSVTVIPKQVMRDQNLNSLDDVIKFTPGLSSNHRDSERYTFYSRGFQIQNFQFDGIPSQMVNESQQFTTALSDMAVYDRVEVVRGATGLLNGSGSPSATLNLVRKRPTAENQASISGEVGARDRYRTEADVSGPLTESGNVRGRLVGVYETANSFVDWYKTDKRVMYGALDIDLSQDTLLRLSLDDQNNNSDGVSFGHIPLFNSDGSSTDFSRSFNPGARWSYLNNSHYNFTSLVEHKLGNDWSLKASYSHLYAYRRGVTGSASRGSPNPLTGAGVSMYVNRLDSYQTQDNADIYASGPFQLGGREHELVIGGNTSYTHLNYPTYELATPSVDNIYQWDGNPGGKPHLSKTDENMTRQLQSGIYTAVRLKPVDALSIILGTRVSWWDTREESSDDLTGADYPTDHVKKNGVVTPYAGIVYDLNDSYSVYASYTDIFQPQTYYKTASNVALDPLEGDNYEVGIKGEFYDGALNASLALFEVQQKNTPQLVDDSGPQEIYRAIAGTKTRGIETEISGEVLPGWNVIGGYTYRESHDNDDNRVETNQPMNLFKLGTTYRLPGEWSKLTVGGNLVWQSDIYAVSGVNKAHQGDYGVVGLLANYKFDEHLSVGVNLNNLFDKKYYDGLGTFSSGSYGEPRNLVANARWDF